MISFRGLLNWFLEIATAKTSHYTWGTHGDQWEKWNFGEGRGRATQEWPPSGKAFLVCRLVYFHICYYYCYYVISSNYYFMYYGWCLKYLFIFLSYVKERRTIDVLRICLPYRIYIQKWFCFTFESNNILCSLRRL